MKKFEIPEMKILVYEVEDVITSSGFGDESLGEDQTPWN